MLVKQKLPLVLNKGLDQKVNPKTQPFGQLGTLENGVFVKRDRIDKRTGHSLIPSTLVAGGALSDPDSIASYRKELIGFDSNSLYSYSPDLSEWSDKGDLVGCTIESDTIYGGSTINAAGFGTYTTTYAMISDVGCYVTPNAALDSSVTIYVNIVDETNGSSIATHSFSLGTSSPLTRAHLSARVIDFDGKFYIFYRDTNDIYGRIIDPAAPDTLGSATLIETVTGTTLSRNGFDAFAWDTDRIVIAYHMNTGIEVNFLDGSLSAVGGSYAAKVKTGADLISTGSAVWLFRGPTDTIYLIYQHDDGTNSGISGYILDDEGTTVHGNDVLHEDTYGAGATQGQISGVAAIANSGGDGMDIYFDPFREAIYQVDSGDTIHEHLTIHTMEYAEDGTVGSVSDWLYTCGLASRWFTSGSDNYIAIFDARGADGDIYTITGSYYIIRQSDKAIVATYGRDVVAIKDQPIDQPNVYQLTSGEWVLPFHTKKEPEAISGNTYYTHNAKRLKLNLTDSDQYNTVELNNTLMIAGGLVRSYDGRTLQEHGFLQAPAINSLTESTIFGSMANNGVYSFIAVYAWTDAQGNIHRSRPSDPVSITLSGSGIGVSVDVAPLILTSKTDVKIEVYRTTDGGSVYYRADLGADNDKTVNNINAITAGGVADATLQGSEPIYTTGGELDNDPPPACKDIVVYKNRAFLIGLEDRYQYLYSKEVIDGVPVEFSIALADQVDRSQGDLKTAAVLDDKLILFKKDSYYYIYGDGPNALGAGGSFSKPQFVSSDAGCDNPRSIVRSPNGVFFKSDKGIYLLDSGLNANYIGAPVEDYNGGTITSAVLVSDNNQVRFTQSGAVMLVYDYYFNQWSTFTNLAAKSACNVDGTYHLLRDNGEILKDDPTVWTDDSETYDLKIASSWISLDQLVGYQRLYKMLFLGDKKSNHRVLIEMGYDFVDAYSHSVTFNPNSVIDDDESYRFIVFAKQQKCESFRFRLTESNQAGTEEGFTISAIGLLVGIKRGLAKFRATQKTGVS